MYLYLFDNMHWLGFYVQFASAKESSILKPRRGIEMKLITVFMM